MAAGSGDVPPARLNIAGVSNGGQDRPDDLWRARRHSRDASATPRSGDVHQPGGSIDPPSISGLEPPHTPRVPGSTVEWSRSVISVAIGSGCIRCTPPPPTEDLERLRWLKRANCSSLTRLGRLGQMTAAVRPIVDRHRNGADRIGAVQGAQRIMTRRRTGGRETRVAARGPDSLVFSFAVVNIPISPHRCCGVIRAHHGIGPNLGIGSAMSGSSCLCPFLLNVIVAWSFSKRTKLRAPCLPALNLLRIVTRGPNVDAVLPSRPCG